jgi:Arc/MetJ-type ribon-helix-helix transcriptional regulator
MSVISLSLPELLKKEVDAIVESGMYENKSELLREALRAYLNERRELRLSAASHLYKTGVISLGKASELSGLSLEGMKEFLLSSGIRIRRYPESVEEAEGGEEALNKMLGGK